MTVDPRLQIILEARDLTGRTFQTVTGRVKAMTGSIFSLQGGIVALAGGYGFGQLVGSLNRTADASGDFYETFSKVNTLFGDAEAQRLRDWGDAAEYTMGLSSQAALDAVGSVGNMFQQLGAADAEAIRLSTGMVQLSADLASFHNVAGGSVAVLDAMQSAFRGEYDALQRYIPTINAAAVVEQALTDTHKKRAGELTALEKAQAAHTIIMRDAGKATGDFARTSDGLANQQRILDSQLANLSVRIGESLLPVKTQIVAETNNWITANETLITQDLPGYVDQVKDAAVGMFETMKTGVSIYEGLPDEIVGAAGAGIVGRILFGATPAGKMATTILMINQAMANMNEDFKSYDFSAQRAVKDLQEGAEASARIWDVITGKRNWNTGSLQGDALDAFNLQQAAARSLAVQAIVPDYIDITPGGPGGGSGGAKAAGPSAFTYTGGTMDAHVKAYVANIEEVNKAWSKVVDDTYDLDAGLESYSDMLTRIEDQTGAVVEETETMSTTMIELSKRTGWAMQQNFGDFFYSFKDGVSDIGDVWNNLTDSMWRAWSDMLGQMAAQGLFGKDFAGGGLLSSIDWAGLLSTSSTLIGPNGATPILPRAVGGDVWAGGTFLVGEEGPELLRMGRNSGTVFPNQAVGGAVVNLTINEAPPGTTVERRQTGDITDIIINVGASGIYRDSPMTDAIEQRYGILPVGRAS